MKKLVFLGLIGFIFVACHATIGDGKPPVGAKRCNSHWDCADNQYCGFYGVDSAPVCKPH